MGKLLLVKILRDYNYLVTISKFSNCLSVFNHFVGFALNPLNASVALI